MCPGFETDIHGLVEIEDDNGHVRYYADCVAEEGRTAKPKGKLVQVGSDGPFGRTI
jgi:hypothetical protein